MVIKPKLVSWLYPDSYQSSAPFLVDAFIENESCIDFASSLNKYFLEVANIINRFLRLKSYVFSKSYKQFEQEGYKKYTYSDFLEDINFFFKFDSSDYDSYYKYDDFDSEEDEDSYFKESMNNHLNDADFLAIANLKYPNEYDRVLTIKANNVVKLLVDEGHGRDFSWWYDYYKYSYRVVVRKNVKIDETREYSLDELISLVNARDILIICKIVEQVTDIKKYKYGIDFFESRQTKQFITEDDKEWLVYINNPDNVFHKFYIPYVKKLMISRNLFNASNETVKAWVSDIENVFKYPSDEELAELIDDDALEYLREDDRSLFEDLSLEQRINQIKQYERQKDLIRKAKEIISQYSEEYQTIIHLLALDT